MELFLQIFLGNIVLLFVLITVHEIGHYVFGMLAGIPAGGMRIRLLTFPQQVVLRDGSDWVSVSDYDRYNAILNSHVPGRGGRYAYVVGGFLFETIFITALTLVLWQMGHWLFAVVAAGVSLMMYFIYIFALDLPQAKSLGKPWGDTTILYSLAPRATLLVSAAMVLIRAGLIAVILLSLR